MAAIMVPVALASDLFADVSDANPFHNDIGAIARAGVTTGCTTGWYCPTENVSRQAMAAFLHRGFGRVAFGTTTGQAVPVGSNDGAMLSVPITVGLPAGALAGAAAFVKGDAEVRIDATNTTGCPCRVRVSLVNADTGDFLDGNFYGVAYVNSTQPQVTVPITGVDTITSSGVKNYVVVAAQTSGTGTTEANVNLTLTYIPFGSTGTNTLGTGVKTSATRTDK